MTLIEIRPHRWGWEAFEAPGIEPLFPKKDQAIDYAQNGACFRSGEVRIFDSTGNVERVIPFARIESCNRDARARGRFQRVVNGLATLRAFYGTLPL